MNPLRHRSLRSSLHVLLWIALAAAGPRRLLRLVFILAAGMMAYNEALAQKIVFVSNRDGNPEVYVMNGDGSGQTRLTNSPEWEYAPRWSPDGTRILVPGRPSDVFLSIYHFGSRLVRMTGPTKGRDSASAARPEDKRTFENCTGC